MLAVAVDEGDLGGALVCLDRVSQDKDESVQGHLPGSFILQEGFDEMALHLRLLFSQQSFEYLQNSRLRHSWEQLLTNGRVYNVSRGSFWPLCPSQSPHSPSSHVLSSVLMSEAIEKLLLEFHWESISNAWLDLREDLEPQLRVYCLVDKGQQSLPLSNIVGYFLVMLTGYLPSDLFQSAELELGGKLIEDLLVYVIGLKEVLRKLHEVQDLSASGINWDLLKLLILLDRFNVVPSKDKRNRLLNVNGLWSSDYSEIWMVDLNNLLID